jgi:hypothetical protein
MFKTVWTRILYSNIPLLHHFITPWIFRRPRPPLPQSRRFCEPEAGLKSKPGPPSGLEAYGQEAGPGFYTLKRTLDMHPTMI